MSYVVNDIADYLEDEGLGTVGTDIFVGNQPETPVNCITVFDTGGQKPSIDIPTKRPTFEVLVRATDYATGKDLIDSVRTLLHNKYNETLVVDGNYFFSINAVAEAGHLGKDELGNDEFSINFVTYVR